MKEFTGIPLRLGVVAVIAGLAAAAETWIATYRDFSWQWNGPMVNGAVAAGLPTSASPGWATPVAVLIGTAAIAAAVLALRRS
jgi:hypothetical protein